MILRRYRKGGRSIMADDASPTDAGRRSTTKGQARQGAESSPLRRSTSYDVARLAGVSQSAVSRCFAEGASIAPKTRDLILKAAAELGYRPNALAQGLISGRTNLVGVLISSLTNRYYPEVLDELARRLTARDIRVLLFALDAEGDVKEALHQLFRHSVDGVICAARLSDAQIRMFEDHRVPLVLYNRTSVSIPVTSVSCDSFAGEQGLVDRLLAAGHRRFAIISGPPDSSVGEERRQAIVDRLQEAGMPEPPMVRGDFSYESGAIGLRALLDGQRSYDAIVCVNDLMAIGAVDTLRLEYGLRVPEDVSVVGFDGSGPAAWASYRLTSIRQPVRRMTEAAVSMLLDRIKDPSSPAERRLFSGEFIAGASARL
jgi:DNA-binding LacI/PurR family transcriptional regulator